MINKTRMKLIEQVAKSSIYPELQGTFKCGKNWIVTNGIIVLYFKEKPDLPIVEGKDYDFNDILDMPLGCHDAPPPNIDVLKQIVKEAKYECEDGITYLPYEVFPNVFVNPKLLLDMVKIFPKLYAINYTDGWRPIVFIDDDIDSPDNYGALLTIRKDVHMPYISLVDGKYEIINPNMGEEIKQEEI